MPQPIIKYRLDDSKVQKDLREKAQRMANLVPIMEVIGEVAVASVVKNFEVGGRPKKWQDLAESTKAERRKTGHWPGEILVRRGSLKKLSYEAGSNGVDIYPPDEPHAAIHHFGGMAGPGHKVEIPARKYMMLQHEDEVEIVHMVSDYVMEGRL